MIIGLGASIGCVTDASVRGRSVDRAKTLCHNFRTTHHCRLIGWQRDRRINTTFRADQNMLKLMCDGYTGEFDMTVYAGLDEKKPDPIDAAMMTIVFVANKECGEYKGRFSHSILSSVYPFVLRVDEAQVVGAVTKLDLPPEIKAGFVDRFRGCKAHVLDLVARMNPRLKRVYVDTVLDTHAQRAKDEKALASFHARYAQLKPALEKALLYKTVTSALRGTAQTLRDDYVDACLKRGRSATSCLTGPVGRPLTLSLLRLNIALKDALLANAEEAALMAGPDRTNVKVEVRFAVDDAVRAENAKADAYMKAKAFVTDPSLLASRFGNPPPERAYEWVGLAGLAPPDRPYYAVDSFQNPNIERIHRAVARVRTNGKKATIVFRDIVSRFDEQTGCRETKKIDRITSSGGIIYREHCNGPWLKRTTRDHIAPITVSARDVRAIKPGRVVMAVAEKKSRRGVVLFVYPGETKNGRNYDPKPLQIRSFPEAQAAR
ncbi:MAG: hypothetical protein HYY84_11080 [Deltaproteobacteria bacterium]|nr:hypothetical protein [Deltaproteobacteria bacterium]